MNGYKEAAKIDKQIGALLDSEKPSHENYIEWLRFARTIRTSLNLIDEVTGKLCATKEYP